MAGRPRRAAAIAAVQRIWNAGDVADDGGLSDLDDGSNNVVHIADVHAAQDIGDCDREESSSCSVEEDVRDRPTTIPPAIGSVPDVKLRLH